MTCLGGRWPLILHSLLRYTPSHKTVPTQTCGRACQGLGLAPSAPSPMANLDVHHTTSSVPCSSLGKGDPATAHAKGPGHSRRGLKGAPPRSLSWALVSAVAVGGRPLPNSPGSAGRPLRGCSQAGSRSEPPASYTGREAHRRVLSPSRPRSDPKSWAGPVSTCPPVCSPVCR